MSTFGNQTHPPPPLPLSTFHELNDISFLKLSECPNNIKKNLLPIVKPNPTPPPLLYYPPLKNINIIYIFVIPRQEPPLLLIHFWGPAPPPYPLFVDQITVLLGTLQ